MELKKIFRKITEKRELEDSEIAIRTMPVTFSEERGEKNVGLEVV